jgi:hypothetical protein
LTILVEAGRAVSCDQRHEFIYVESFGGGASLIHNGVAAIGREQYKPYLELVRHQVRQRSAHT